MSEVNALKTLRETTLAHLSQSDYERILKAVEVGGIESLTGTASMIVKSAVLKHGSHDQSSHNPKKGGGGGAGGSTSSRGERQDIMDSKIAAAKEDIANRVKGAESMRGRTPKEVNPDVADAHIDGLVEGYKESAKLIGERGKLVKLRQESNMSIPPLPSAAADLSEFTDRAKAKGFAEAVEQVSNRYSDLDNSLETRADIKGPAFPMGTYGEYFGD